MDRGWRREGDSFIDIYFVHSVLLRDLSLSLAPYPHPLTVNLYAPTSCRDNRVSSYSGRRRNFVFDRGIAWDGWSPFPRARYLLLLLLLLLLLRSKRVFPRYALHRVARYSDSVPSSTPLQALVITGTFRETGERKRHNNKHDTSEETESLAAPLSKPAQFIASLHGNWRASARYYDPLPIRSSTSTYPRYLI